jgi:hypothetical protein
MATNGTVSWHILEKQSNVKLLVSDVFFGPVVSFLFYYLFDYIGRECGITLKKVKLSKKAQIVSQVGFYSQATRL